MNIVDSILLVAASFGVGYLLSFWIHEKAFAKLLHKIGVSEQHLKDALQKDAGANRDVRDVEVHIEVDNGILYAYDSRGLFLGQGNTQDELIRRLRDRFKDRTTRLFIPSDRGGDLIKDPVDSSL